MYRFQLVQECIEWHILSFCLSMCLLSNQLTHLEGNFFFHVSCAVGGTCFPSWKPVVIFVAAGVLRNVPRDIRGRRGLGQNRSKAAQLLGIPCMVGYVMICDDMWWYVMICDDMWWYVMICDDMWLVWNKWSTIQTAYHTIFLVGGLVAIFGIFPYIWVANHPNWRTHIFQRGFSPTTNQTLYLYGEPFFSSWIWIEW